MPHDMKQAIAEALISMLEEKSLDKITVKDLVEGCGICRQTFYYHFQDLMDVIEWTITRTMQRTLKESLAAEDAQGALMAFVASAVEGRDLIQKLLASQRRAQVERIMVQSFRSYLQEMTRRRLSDLVLSPADQAMLLDFYSFGIVGLLLEHSQGRHVDVDALVSRMYRLLSGQIAGFLFQKV